MSDRITAMGLAIYGSLADLADTVPPSHDFVFRSKETNEKLRGMAKDYGFIPVGRRSVGKSYFEQILKLQEYYKMRLLSETGLPHSAFYKRKDKNQTVINFDLESAEKSVFPTKELKEQLNKLKTKKMKTKKFYHTFEYENRKVTLCLLVEEQERTFSQRLYDIEPTASIKVGYAVCVPEDTFNQDLAKRISLGRAESDKARLHDLGMSVAKEFAFDLGILNSTARIFERRIKRGTVVIKGIESAIEKGKKETTKPLDTPTVISNEEEE